MSYSIGCSENYEKTSESDVNSLLALKESFKEKIGISNKTNEKQHKLVQLSRLFCWHKFSVNLKLNVGNLKFSEN